MACRKPDGAAMVVCDMIEHVGWEGSKEPGSQRGIPRFDVLPIQDLFSEVLMVLRGTSVNVRR